MELSDFLAKIYDKSQRIFPQTAHRTVKTWVVRQDDSEEEWPYEWAADNDSWESCANAIWSDDNVEWATLPMHIAVGAGALNNHSTLPNDDEITNEIERQEVEILYTYQDEFKIKFAAQFTSGIGVGNWHQAGLFYGDSKHAILSDCNTSTNWTTGSGDILIDTDTVAYGESALKKEGSSDLVFQILNGLDAYTEVFTESLAYFQIYYRNGTYTSNTTINTALRSAVFYFSSNASDPTTDCYVYTGLSSAQRGSDSSFSHVNIKLTECTKVGTPDLTSIKSFRFSYSHSGIEAIDAIDRIRIFQPDGVRRELAMMEQPKIKQFGEVCWVYWYVTYTNTKPEYIFAVPSEDVSISESFTILTS